MKLRVSFQTFTSLAPIVVATLALGLSQLRPLHEFFERPVIGINYGNSVGVDHVWGSVVLSTAVYLRNEGRAKGYLNNLKIYLEKSDTPNQYWSRSAGFVDFVASVSWDRGGRNRARFHRVPITAGSDVTLWVHYLSRKELDHEGRIRRIREFQDRINNIETRIIAPPSERLKYGMFPIYQLPRNLLEEVTRFIEPGLSGLTPGEYNLFIAAWFGDEESAPEGNPPMTTCITFALSDLHLSNFSTFPYYTEREPYNPSRGVIEVPITGKCSLEVAQKLKSKI